MDDLKPNYEYSQVNATAHTKMGHIETPTGKLFSLNDRQNKKLNEWQKAIKEQYGEYGHYDYIFTPYGIGTEVKVKSHLTGIQIDLSEVEFW